MKLWRALVSVNFHFQFKTLKNLSSSLPMALFHINCYQLTAQFAHLLFLSYQFFHYNVNPCFNVSDFWKQMSDIYVVRESASLPRLLPFRKVWNFNTYKSCHWFPWDQELAFFRFWLKKVSGCVVNTISGPCSTVLLVNDALIFPAPNPRTYSQCRERMAWKLPAH